MTIIVMSLIVTIALCLFILLAVLFGTISAIVISAAMCAVIFVVMMGALLGLAAMWLERRERRMIDHFVERSHG